MRDYIIRYFRHPQVLVGRAVKADPDGGGRPE